ncbi:hypothetical protein BG006_007110 [Podila minutissima]|uniref:Complex 1 LYR protein domain-containing protein n=1 Tax=Podila minutissima TaxID=64525 RepID=A0A9P5SHS3_9FUNG|nr:hypothetical protein BG006_007110 [Podila minutissima]
MPGRTMQQARVLGLYRQLLKIGKAMPTETRSSLVLSRVKGDFRANIAEKDPEEIEAMVQLAELQVDNLQIQRDHLTELSKNPNLIIPVDIYKNAKPKLKDSNRTRDGKIGMSPALAALGPPLQVDNPSSLDLSWASSYNATAPDI